MNEETIQLIDKLADKLGTTAEQLMAVVVAQSEVVLYKEVFVVIFCLTFIIVLIVAAYRNRNSKYLEDDFIKFIAVLMILIVLVLPVSLLYNGIYIISTLILNPEYWVIYNIFSMLK